MGNVVFGDSRGCFETADYCTRSCPEPAQCIWVDRCGDSSSSAHYACLPFDLRFLTWIFVGCFIIVVLCCSALVVCFAIRAIRRALRHPIQTDGDIIFYNARNVHHFPHPGAIKYTNSADQREYNLKRNGYYY
ncbi:hypothetical protein ACQ4LE_007044 [Meloidogyne hapla]|uniref:PSI domain-containing protein n=1 Tax=Meloidogyne hapla TaxID=6305 RepID=A0A1I8BUT7_MELHA